MRRLHWDDARHAGLLLVATAVPLAFSPDLADHFVLPKVVVLHAAVALILLAWIGEAVDGGRRPRLPTAAGLGAAAFLLTQAAATVTSIDPLTSLLGLYGRQMGLVTAASAMVVLLAAAAPISSSRRLSLVWAATVAASVAAGYGVLQHLGADPIHWVVDIPGRAAATLGNPITLGAELLLTFPVALVLAVGSRGWQRGAATAMSGLQVLGLVFTYSRAAWLGVLLEVALAGAWAWHQTPSTRRRVAILAVGLGVVSLAAGLAVATGQGPLDVRTRVGGLLHRDDVSLLARESFLGTGWRLLQARPLLGHGPDTVQYAYPALRGPEEARTAPATIVTKLHSEPLQVAVTSGITGLAGWLAMLLAVLLPAWRRLRRGGAGTSGLELGLLVGVVGLLAALLAGFSEVPLLAGLGLWLGLLAGMPLPALAAHSRPALAWPGLATAAALAVAPVVALDLPAVMADHAALSGRFLAAHGDHAGARAAFTDATRLTPGEPSYHFALGAEILAGCRRVECHQSAGTDAAGQFRAVTAREPLDAYALAALAATDARTGINRTEAIAAADRAAVLDPRDPQLLVECATTFSVLGDNVRTRELAKQALTLNPDFSPARRLIDSLS